jgi:hypothetical protein
LYTNNIVNVAYLLLDYTDIDLIVYIAEPLLKSIFLIANQRTDQVPPLLGYLVSRINESKNIFFWHVLMDVIFQYLKYTENAFDCIQPNFVGHLIL